MACTYTYKGREYTEEQMQDYVNNNPSEFTNDNQEDFFAPEEEATSINSFAKLIEPLWFTPASAIINTLSNFKSISNF